MKLYANKMFRSLSVCSCASQLQTVRQTFPALIIHSFLSYSLCSPAALTLILLCLCRKKKKKKVQETKCHFLKSVPAYQFLRNGNVSGIEMVFKILKMRPGNILNSKLRLSMTLIWCKFSLHKSERAVQG